MEYMKRKSHFLRILMDSLSYLRCLLLSIQRDPVVPSSAVIPAAFLYTG